MMLRDRKQLGAVAAGEQKISALTRTAATLSDLGNAPESHTEQIGRPMARVAEPVSAGLGRANLSNNYVPLEYQNLQIFKFQNYFRYRLID